jgi:tetratricopeptide (TPR) repeat protein/DNA-binding CsgD family transcriptional regulator
MRAFGPFRRRDKPGAALRVKSGDAFAACAEKYGITSREAEIIRLLLEGKDTKRITEDLFISDHTVKNHIHNIYRKLGVRNRIQLVRCFQTALEEPGRLADVPATRPRVGTILRRIAVPGLVAAAVVAAALIAWKPWGRWPRPAAFPPVPALAVLDFETISDDPDLQKWATGFPTLLATDLQQSKRLRIVGDDVVFGALRKFGLTGSGRYSRDELRRLSREIKADYLLCGSLMKAGGSIVITTFLQDARTGATIRTEKAECPDEQALLREVDGLARLVKSGLDLKVPIEEDIDLDVEELTTSYALAYRYYAEALRYHRTGDYEQSLLMLKKAVELDPEFAMAYRLMSVDSRNLGYFAQEADYMRTAFDLSARLPENSRERHLIRGDYYSLSESTIGLSIEAYKLVLRDHPDDLIANNNLGLHYSEQEEFETAVRHADVPIRRDTEHPFPYYTKAGALKALGRTAEAVRLLEAYHKKHPANRLIFWTLVEVLTDAHDYPAALAALDGAEAVFPDPSWSFLRGTVLFHTGKAAEARVEFRRLFLFEELPWRLSGYDRLGCLALSEGRFREAALEFDHGTTLAETAGQPSWASFLGRLHGRALLEAGDVAGALAEARRSVETVRSAGAGYRLARALYFLAQVHLQSGDAAGAAVVAEQGRALAAATGTRRVRRASVFLDGLAELAAGRPAEAAKIIEQALAQFTRKDGSDDSVIYFRYYLASAREKTGDLAGAVQALQAILDAPGDSLYYEGFVAKALLGLARLEEKLGRPAAARERYRAFLELWKDADPGRPEVAEARRSLGLS